MSLSSPPLPPAFRRLACSNLAAQFSEQIALAAAPLVAVLLLGVGAAGTGILQTAQTLPFLLLALPAGVVADRASRRRLMVGSEALRAVALLATLLLVATGRIDFPSLAALGFLGAVGTVAYNVSAPAMLPSLVPRAKLASANRWLELARSVAFAAGPAIGGAIVGATGAPAAYVAATFLSVLAVVLLSGLPEPARAVRSRRPILHDLCEGARFVAGHALLRPILITGMFFNTAWFILQAVYVAYAVERLGLGAAGVGMTLGAFGAGMVVGAVLAARLSRWLSCGAMIAVGPLCGLIAALVMLSTLWVPSGVLAGASFFLFGAGPILWTITTTTLRQAVTPDAMLGRVSALIVTATFGSRPIGAALGAIIAIRFGVEACLAGSACGFFIQFLFLYTSPVLRLDHLPEPV